MNKTGTGILFYLVTSILAGVLQAQVRGTAALPWPNNIIPGNLGVNTYHPSYIEDKGALLEGIVATGTRYARAQVLWRQVETSRGVYEFGAYHQKSAYVPGTDLFVTSLADRKMIPVLVLFGSNPLYCPKEELPTTPAQIKAFTNFAVAAAQHFQNKVVLWEIWNEPNYAQFTPAQYANLASAVAKAIKEKVPSATVTAGSLALYWGPGWFRDVLAAQPLLLHDLDAVTVHPYSEFTAPTTPDTNPESTSLKIYTELETIMAAYQPPRRKVPVITTEVGYARQQVGDEQAAQYLAREWLMHQYLGAQLCVWYAWRDWTRDPNDLESTFGLWDVNVQVRHRSDYAAETFISRLTGYHFDTSLLPVTSSGDYEFRFLNGTNGRKTLVVWTTEPEHAVTINGFTGSPSHLAHVRSMEGVDTTLTVNNGSITVTLEQSPQYIDMQP